MSEFDIQLGPYRRIWHNSTFTPSGEWLPEHVDSSPVKTSPRYEKGLRRAISSLPEHLKVMGDFFWSAWVEGSIDDKARYYALTTYYLQCHLLELDKPQKWKQRAMILAMYAVTETRHSNPPDMSASRTKLYTQAFLLERAGIASKDFARELGDPWGYSLALLDDWVRDALIPVADWVKQLKDKQAA